MKKLLLMLAAVIVALAGCKTNEANYRAAYEKAKEKRTETGDSTITSKLRSELTPKDMVIDGVTLPVRTEPLRAISPEKDAPVPVLKRYCVVVAQFRQMFNARSLRTRLAESGYEGAVVVANRQDDYYVCAATTAVPAEAAEVLRRLGEEKSIAIHEPFPYVLRPAQLVR